MSNNTQQTHEVNSTADRHSREMKLMSRFHSLSAEMDQLVKGRYPEEFSSEILFVAHACRGVLHMMNVKPADRRLISLDCAHIDHDPKVILATISEASIRGESK